MKQIPDAAVQAALDSWFSPELENHKELHFDDMKELIAAVIPHLPLGFDVKRLGADERRNRMWDCGFGYMIGWNNEDYYRVRFHDKIILKKIKGFAKALEWVNKHHSQLILSAIDMTATVTNVATKPIDVAAVRRLAFEEGFEDAVEQSLGALHSYDDITRNEAEQAIRTLKPDYRALSAEPAQGDP